MTEKMDKKIRVIDISDIDEEISRKPIDKIAFSKLGKNKIAGFNDGVDDMKIFSDKTLTSQQERKKHFGFIVVCGFLKEVSIGGFKYVGDVSINMMRRLIWFLIVIVALGGMVYMINLNVAYFVLRPTSTKVESVYVDRLKFPAVTICNYNMVRKNLLIEEDIIAYNLIKTMFPVQFGEATIPNFTGFNFDGFDMNTFRQYYGHQKLDMIYRCKWKGKSCTYVNFTLVGTDFDSCFTFNGVDSGMEALSTDSAGGSFGLSLVLNAEENEYMNGPYESVGFKIFVGDQTEIPLVGDFGFAVSPGQETIARIKMTKIMSLPSPYGSCGTTDLNFYNNTEYTYSACILECKTDYVVDQCGCKEYYMPGFAANCNPEEIYSCYLPAIDEFAQLGTSSCGCKIPCEMIQYTPSLSYAVFPNEPAIEYLETNYNMTEEDIKKNLAKVEIYFQEIMYELRTEQEAYTAINLFSDIGGSLGLLVGSSIITILEILDFIFVNLARAF